MFGNSIIDIAIGLTLMYLVLSLLCTVVNEYVAALVKTRAETLKETIESLLDHKALRDNFNKHGLVRGAKVASGDGGQPTDPSYLPSRTVAMALIGSLETGKQVPLFADIKAAVEQLGNSNIKSALLASITEANSDLDKLRASIATWFDDAMDRLSGEYRRNLKMISLCVGLGVAVLMNADSLRVGRALWLDKDMREQTAKQAEAFVKQCKDACIAQKGDTADIQAASKNLQERWQATLSELRPLPIGWNEDWKSLKDWWWWPQKIIGLLVTGLALSLGAPFWFDLLNKFMSLRGTGQKPQREDKKQ
jgi:hypothetical protein